MSVAYFVWIGSGRARKRPVGLEGRLLDQAAHAGLPVPPGAILLDEFYRVCLDNGLAETRDGHAIIPDAELLVNTLFHSARLPSFERPIAVWRISPLGIKEALPPFDHPARFPVDPRRTEALADALSAAWSWLEARPQDRRDLLLVEQVGAVQFGLAHLREGKDNDTVEVCGRGSSTSTLLLPVLRGWKAPDDALPPFARRLQMLLRGVRRTFGSGDWEIEWADDNQICRLTRAFPLSPDTRPVS